MLCPECGSDAKRSHSRGIKERIFKSLSGYRIYRCKDCSWRGWLSRERGKTVDKKGVVRTYLLFMITLVVAMAVALYAASALSGSRLLARPGQEPQDTEEPAQ
ncbi:MAG: hypothetical protein ACKV2V_24220 [Blastocatellia bacterium]